MAESVTLTVRRILDLHRGLNSLDAVKQGKDEIVPLEFTGAVRAKIIVDSQAAEVVKVAHDATDRALAKQHGVFQGMPETPENAQKMESYRQAVEDALNVEREIEVEKIKLSALLNRPGDGKAIKLNPIPQSVLNRLAPILELEEA